MGQRNVVRLPSFQGVLAGQTATIDLPALDIYHGLMISYVTDTAGGATQANMETEITEIRLKVNGKVQRRASAREIFDIYGYRNRAVVAGKIPIFFSEPWRRTPVGEDALAWGMGDVDTFQLEIDVANNASQVCSLSALAVKQPGTLSMGAIVKWKKFTVPVSATGIVNVTTLPKQDAYYAMHALSANIADVLVKTDQRDRYDYTLAEATTLQGWNGWTPNADWFHLDFTETGRGNDALTMVSEDGQRRVADLQVDFNMSSAANFTLLTETVGYRD